MTAEAPVARRWGRRPRLVHGILPAAVVGGLALSCGVALTTTAGWLIVRAAERPQILTLLAAIVLVRAFGMARPALRYAERIRSHDAALDFLAEERARTYARLIPLTPARLGRRSRGDLLAAVVDDLDDIAYAQVRVVVPVVALLVTGLVTAFTAALFLLPAVPVVLSQVVCTLVVGWAEFHVERRAHRELVTARAEVARITGVVAGNSVELASIGADREALDRVDRAHEALGQAIRRQGRGRALGVAAVPLITVAHTCLMAVVVSSWTPALAPSLAALLLLMPVALGEVVSGIPDAMGALARALSATARLDALLRQRPAVRTAPADSCRADGPHAPDGPPRVPEVSGSARPGACLAAEPTAPARPPELALHAVTATWDARRTALRRLSHCFAPGRRVAIVGPNGSGKSTLLAILARHLDPDTGTYTMDGVDVTTMPPSAARDRLAVVDDEPHVFASTLRENLRFARPGAEDAALVAALRQAGLQDWYEALPDGLDTALGATGRGVSGGERARLAIARALLSERPVLLLDEPVAHLDHPLAVAVLADLWAATAERSVVLVAHRAEGVADVDEVLVLDVADPTPPPLAGPR